MRSKPGRTLPPASSTTAKALARRLAAALCLIALIVGAMWLRAARLNRHDAAAVTQLPATGVAEQSPPAAQAAAPAASDARPTAVATMKPQAGPQTGARVISKRVKLRLRAITPAAVALKDDAPDAQPPAAKIETAGAEVDPLPLRLMTPAVTPFNVTPPAPVAPATSISTVEPSLIAEREASAREVFADDESKEPHAGAAGGRRMHRANGAQESGQSSQAAQGERVAAQGERPSGPEVVQMVGPVSQDLDLRQLANIPGKGEEDEVRRTRHPMVPNQQAQGMDDPELTFRPQALSSMPATSVSFDGINQFNSSCACLPPDTHGDVGPNHYILSVNSSIQIYNKSGTTLSGPTNFNSFFSALGTSTPCGNNQNEGDGFILYDHIANRWVISDFAFTGSGSVNYQCVGVSKTADPVSGGWWLYAVQVDPSNPTWLGDYPKFGLWPDAYYFSVNLFDQNDDFQGVRVYALNRSQMINGTGAPAAGAVAFTILPAALGDTYSLVPATFRTGSTPPAGAAEYFMAIDSPATGGTILNKVYTWRFHVDFATPANSTLGVGATHTPNGTTTVDNFVDAFTSTSSLVPQNGTSQKLDTLGDKLMTPLVYHNLLGVESLWASHTINNNQNGTGPTAIRWYQFNVTGGTIPATPLQQQTFNNGADGLWRFMPSIAVDALGNMSIGYMTSSSTTEPSITYAGRLVSDPLNTLGQGEAQLIAGGGHQTSASGRWGDYSSLSIDPSDNCTFWHANEYYSATSTSSWKTRVGAFKFPTCSGGTQAKVKTFNASRAADGRVLLQWNSSVEVDNLGYHVYREQNGVRTRITPQLVGGSALLVGPGKSLLSGHSYSWADTPPAGAARYWLEDVDLNGKSTWHGPFVATATPAKNSAAGLGQSLMLSQLGLRESMLVSGTISQAAVNAAPLAPLTPVALKAQSALAARPAVKMAIKQEGFYRVTQAELVAAGLDPRVDPRSLQLFVDGVEQPIKVRGEQDGRFDAGDAIEFYATGLDVASTDTRVYWLAAGDAMGKRINTAVAKGKPAVASDFPYTIERKDRSVYFTVLRNGEGENFFGATVSGQPLDQSLWVQHLAAKKNDTATVEVSLQGLTHLPHTVALQLNGAEIGTLDFTGQSAGKTSLAIPASLLKEGENHVQLVARGGPSDVSLLDAIRITYPHSFVADNNALRLTAQGGQQVSIAGFTGAAVRLIDVTDANAVQEIQGAVSGGKGGYAITAAVPGAGERRLLALSDSQIKKPVTTTANQPSRWRRAANGADLLIFTRRDFAAALQPLVALRQSQGLSVAVVDVEDVYDEFSFGNKTPQALKDFVSYAASHWKQAPRFLLLAGSASYDARNYLGFGDSDVVPTKLIDTAEMETASDDWFADIADDGLARLAVGRLPARTPTEAAALVAKIIAYEHSSPAREATLVADANDGFNFETAARQLATLMPDTLKVNQIARGAGDSTARGELLAALSRGQKVVNYVGHGNVNLWRGDLLTNEDASRLTNADHLPLFVMMTCLNGYFIDPALDSLGGSLLKAERGGAVAVWASSGITGPADQAQMNQQLYRLLFGDAGLRMGEAVTKAKAAISDRDVRRTWILLGDPTMKLR
ncbi:MAG TPA: C25 family cysteine peptidase [Blastocatellia bacterium]|nr:C25 family cysteine peptidase [Blastocatellia bacterium]